jgi:uncharacterized protein with ParB-like and HNH nuclease domain
MKPFKEFIAPFEILKPSSGELILCKIKDLHNKRLDFNVWLPTKQTNLQRNKVWSLLQKQQLVLSVFLGRYIPPACIMSIVDRHNSKLEDIKQVIDGKQRLTTLMDYLDDKFPIEVEGESYLFRELPSDWQQEFSHYWVRHKVINEDLTVPITDDQKVLWFEQINFLGTPQDINHLNRIKGK